MVERPTPTNPDDRPERDRWDVYRNILVLKRLGFSMDEIREMTMPEFIAFTDLVAEESGESKDDNTERVVVREATQADIDRLLA